MFGPVDVVDVVDSTNTTLVERARSGAPEGAVLVADRQTAGRGRLGRTWEADPGAALLVSVLLRPPLAAGDVHLVTLCAALAAVDVARALGADVGLKWPNDIVVGDRKLAGLLSEAVVVGSKIDAVVVGMGLNLRTTTPHEDRISLSDVLGRGVSRDEILGPWLERLAERYAALLAPDGVAATLEALRDGCVTLGRRVRVELPGRTVVGVATDIGQAGSLVVVDDRGEHHDVLAGDVVHVRPATG